MAKMEFMAIGYGDSSEIKNVLEKMATNLNGRMKTCLEA
jgi:hypothetical protein